MGLLTCGCLNVKIHVKNTDLKQVELSDLDGADSSEQFFAQKISTTHLNLEGIIVEHWYLVKKKICGLWSLHRCVNCNMWTHALKQSHAQGSSLVLVSMALQNEETNISSLGRSIDFSPLYKVILRDKNDNQPLQPIGVQSEKYESLQKTLTTIQQQLNKFLVNEENAMEERIKEYEKAQRFAFAELQKKARQDKNNLIRMILNAEDEDEVDCSTAVLDNMITESSPKTKEPVQSSVTSAKPFKTIGFNVEESAVKKPVVQSNTNTAKMSTKVVQNYSKSTSALSSRLGNNNPLKEPDGQLFDMDPTFGEDNVSSRPFYNSDDEEENEDTDDSELDSPASNPTAMFSTSVPISVPSWKNARQMSKHKDLEEDDESTTDPDNIAASIKALAKSVQYSDGSEIFGDLPRRPRQAMEYGSSVM